MGRDPEEPKPLADQGRSEKPGGKEAHVLRHAAGPKRSVEPDDGFGCHGRQR
jgi:hypothetical protein